ncbi:12S seed storage protein CRB-like [Durio zibethinus]|uniref:12S seed storage protein CRB-like n=1 Tax=Durio zibethinus TaxID=66656 RepID=A0A6P5XHF3_DURZI|nr:12S seed storage protein CRB-like [Durio zibethinus]
MNMDLSPKFPRTFAETESGGYYNWAVADSPALGEAKVAAGKLVLRPRGFAFPHYADCSKVGYVLEGNCAVGLTLPANTIDKTAFIGLKKGDIIPVPSASVSWWYNYGNSDVVIVFLGDATEAYVSGEITYFLLTGPQGHLAAFSPEFIARTYHVNVEKAQKLADSQKGVLIIKLGQEEAEGIPKPYDVVNIWTQNIDGASPDVQVKNGGKSTTLTGNKFPFLEQVGLNVTHLVLETSATRAPAYASDAQVYYVAKGSGKVQIVGLQGKLVLNTKVENGQIFVVPKLFMVTISADAEGIELVSIVTSTRPVTGELAGKNSVLNTIPSILQASLNVTPELNQHFRRMMETGTTIVPPMNLYQA